MTNNPTSTLRLRIFAGPNGSGKTSIIRQIQSHKINDKTLDLGVYINADDIANALRKNQFTFDYYNIETYAEEFIGICMQSGLIGPHWPEADFRNCFRFHGQQLLLIEAGWHEHLAQITADFLRKKLLDTRQKFSFETVFSHQSKLDVMREAIAAGYKVYLYYVATESPLINKYRVKVRVQQGGHDVKEELIESRYYRSLGLMYDAAQLAYQAYFFDNSDDKPENSFFAHFKKVAGVKKWDTFKKEDVPNWFYVWYSERAAQKKSEKHH